MPMRQRTPGDPSQKPGSRPTTLPQDQFDPRAIEVLSGRLLLALRGLLEPHYQLPLVAAYRRLPFERSQCHILSGSRQQFPDCACTGLAPAA